jgi:signal recognition particle receptor subunit beta
MVFLNYTTMQMTAKIVYYGPGLCGKTTNLHWIHLKTAPRSRGEMVSLETETDRTLFFDLLPLDVGVIGGMKVRLQLYTVPGQVFYNATRRLVLKGVDGVVFVADSQSPALEPNEESLANLKANLEELGTSFEQVPVVFQYNKRDLRNILAVDRLQKALNPGGKAYFEAAAVHGLGVFETLKDVSRHALSSIRAKITEETKKQREAAAPARTDPLFFPKAPAASSPSSVVRSAPETRPASPIGAKAAAAPAADEGGLESLLSEPMHVEFAEEDTDKHVVRPVRTKGNVDITKELEKLRTVTSPEATRPPSSARDRDVDKLFQDLMVSDKESRHEVKRKAAVDVPARLLKGMSDVRIHLAFTYEGKQEVVEDALVVKVVGTKRLERLTLHLDLELKAKS